MSAAARYATSARTCWTRPRNLERQSQRAAPARRDSSAPTAHSAGVAIDKLSPSPVPASQGEHRRPPDRGASSRERVSVQRLRRFRAMRSNVPTAWQSIGCSRQDGHGRPTQFGRASRGTATWRAPAPIAAPAVLGQAIREWERKALDLAYVICPLPRIRFPMDHVKLGSKI